MSARDFLARGRVAQKRRTRQALLEAARRILERDEEPTLESIAAEADVSRATAYRYFPRVDALLGVIPLAGLVANQETILGDDPDDDPSDRVGRVQRYFYDLAADNEMAFRRMIKAVHEETLRADPEDEYEPLRGGYRLAALDRALAPLAQEVDETTLADLRLALVALTGFEALTVVKDVCGLEAAAGRRSLEWAARALVDAARRQDRSREALAGVSHQSP
jgi:AcrR family transcriptional regulator